MIPRGIRNNNPCNIRRSQTVWQGQVAGVDPDFVTFDTPLHGIRAGAKILWNYHRLYGLQTIAEIVSRWAPSSENDTASYIAAVAHAMGVAANDNLNLLSGTILAQLIAAIIAHENGQQPYPFAMIEQAAGLVLNQDVA